MLEAVSALRIKSLLLPIINFVSFLIWGSPDAAYNLGLLAIGGGGGKEQVLSTTQLNRWLFLRLQNYGGIWAHLIKNKSVDDHPPIVDEGPPNEGPRKRKKEPRAAFILEKNGAVLERGGRA